MQYKVPQNIDLEDKIIGPLTMLQFIYLMVGGMIVYVAFETFEFGVFIIIAFPVALLAICLAFVKVQDQPFSKFLIAALFYLTRPKSRVWYKNPQAEKFKSELVNKKPTQKEKTEIAHKTVEKSELEKLAMILDTGKAKELTKKSNSPGQNQVEDIFASSNHQPSKENSKLSPTEKKPHG